MTNDDSKPVTREWILAELKGLFHNAPESTVKLKCLELLLENQPPVERKKVPGVLEEARAKARG